MKSIKVCNRLIFRNDGLVEGRFPFGSGARDLLADSRTRLEKYFDVLIAIRKGHHGTEQIVQQTNISPQDVESILESLKSLEFVEKVNDLD